MQNAKPNMHSLVKACENLGVSYKQMDEMGNFLVININNQDLYFNNVRVPLSTESVAMICTNKIYTYWLLENELPMPKTKSYLDPNSEDEAVRNAASFKKQKHIVEDILKNFQFPLIVKMNAGLQGRHVYKCDTKRKVAKAVKAIFKKRQANYDSSLLAQDFIEIEHEYRVILMEGEMLLNYEKVSLNKNRNLSPLHNDDGKAILIKDEEINNQIRNIVSQSPRLKDLEWIGLDIASDKNGNWWILELNTRPGFSYYIRDNGDEEIVKVYEKLLTRIKNGKN